MCTTHLSIVIIYCKFGKILEGYIFAKLHMTLCKVSRTQKTHKIAKSLCRLQICFFNAVLENRILAKIYGFRVCDVASVVVDRI